MKVILYLLFLIMCFSCLSCQKELRDATTLPDSVDSTNSIIGAWKFTSIEVKTEGSSELKIANANQKVQLFLDYLTADNNGTIVIDDTAMHCTGIAYKINTKIKIYRYKNDILVDSLERPFIRSFPETDSYTTYKRASDSIYFKMNGFTNISARFRVSSPAAKIELKDNLLTFTESISKDSIESVSGVKYHIIQKGVSIMTFSKQ